MLISWRLREVPPGPGYPVGAREEMAEAWYEPHERELMRRLARQVRDSEAGSPEREEAMSCIDTIHELKVSFGARVLADDYALAVTRNHGRDLASTAEED